MKEFLEGLVLIGGFLAFSAFGYYEISKLGDFLDQNWADGAGAHDPQQAQEELNIASESLCEMQAGSKVLEDMEKEQPNLHCTLSVGEEPEKAALCCKQRKRPRRLGWMW